MDRKKQKTHRGLTWERENPVKEFVCHFLMQGEARSHVTKFYLF